MYLPKIVLNTPLVTRLYALVWLLIWCALILTSWYSRPLLPFQETYLASSTWQMWLHQHYLTSLNNGLISTETFPLTHWIELILWHIFGPSELLLRLTPALLSFLILLLTAFCAKQLWPLDKKVRALAPLILIGSFVWILFATAHIQYITLSFLQILSVSFLICAWRRHPAYWCGVALSLTLGLFSSGIIFYFYVLPLALTQPIWAKKTNAYLKNRYIWFISLSISIICSLSIFIIWGKLVQYHYPSILLGDVLGMNALFSHINAPMPLGFYLLVLPFILFPWALWPPIYRHFYQAQWDHCLKFCLCWLGSLLATVGVLGTSPIAPLLPIYPVIALIIAKTHGNTYCQRKDTLLIVIIGIITGLFLALIPLLEYMNFFPDWVDSVSPFWGIGLIIFSITLYFQAHSTRLHTLSLMSLALVLALNFGVVQASAHFYDLKPAAMVIAKLQKTGVTVAHQGRYQNQFHFAGRLKQPLLILKTQQQFLQLRTHSPEAILVLYPEEMTVTLKQHAIYWQAFRGRYLAMVPMHFLQELFEDTHELDNDLRLPIHYQ